MFKGTDIKPFENKIWLASPTMHGEELQYMTEAYETNWIINVSGAIANVILNFSLIPYLGMNGAAISSIITQFFSNVVIGFLIKDIRPNNKLMVKALSPKYAIDIAKMLIKR